MAAFAALVVAGGAWTAMAQSGGRSDRRDIHRDRQDLRRDRLDIRSDGRDLRSDRRDLHGDLREYRQDKRTSDSAEELAADRRGYLVTGARSLVIGGICTAIVRTCGMTGETCAVITAILVVTSPGHRAQKEWRLV